MIIVRAGSGWIWVGWEGYGLVVVVMVIVGRVG